MRCWRLGRDWTPVAAWRRPSQRPRSTDWHPSAVYSRRRRCTVLLEDRPRDFRHTRSPRPTVLHAPVRITNASPMTCGTCLCHEHITNSVIGVSRPLVLDCGTTFHLDSGGRDLPWTLSDNLRKLIYLATEALSDSFWIYRRYINKFIYLSIYLLATTGLSDDSRRHAADTRNPNPNTNPLFLLFFHEQYDFCNWKYTANDVKCEGCAAFALTYGRI